MKIRIDTTKLALPGDGAGAEWGWQSKVPRAVKLAAVRELIEIGLCPHDVRRLVRRLGDEKTAMGIVLNWPTVTQDKASLKAVVELARGLGVVLADASPRAQAQIATAALTALGDATFPHTLPSELARFAAALQGRIDKMPKQSRREAPKRLVNAVVVIAGQKLGKITTWPESPFRRACVAAFQLAGVSTSPDNAIKAITTNA